MKKKLLLVLVLLLLLAAAAPVVYAGSDCSEHPKHCPSDNWNFIIPPGWATDTSTEDGNVYGQLRCVGD